MDRKLKYEIREEISLFYTRGRVDLYISIISFLTMFCFVGFFFFYNVSFYFFCRCILSFMPFLPLLDTLHIAMTEIRPGPLQELTR